MSFVEINLMETNWKQELTNEQWQEGALYNHFQDWDTWLYWNNSTKLFCDWIVCIVDIMFRSTNDDVAINNKPSAILIASHLKSKVRVRNAASPFRLFSRLYSIGRWFRFPAPWRVTNGNGGKVSLCWCCACRWKDHEFYASVLNHFLVRTGITLIWRNFYRSIVSWLLLQGVLIWGAWRTRRTGHYQKEFFPCNRKLSKHDALLAYAERDNDIHILCAWII